MITTETILLTIFLAILTFAVPRKYLTLPFVIAACFIPDNQRIIILGLDFTPLRLLVLCGIFRMLAQGEQRQIKWNLFDKMVFAWVFFGFIIYTILWGNLKAVINRCGVSFDILGLYWLFRQNITSWDDITVTMKLLAVSAIISAILVVFERLTKQNPFAIFGWTHTGIHRGRYRCSGSFQHAILLGLFWVNLIPIFIGYAISSRSKSSGWWTAAAACMLIVFATGSSTPISAFLWVLLLLLLFRYRHYGKEIAIGFFGILLVLHVVMAKPVWHLIGRVNIVAGSTGYHRYRLIDQAINHFTEWFLLGTRNTTHWGYGMQDVTNNYIVQAVNGGIITLLLFIAIMVMAVKISGRYSLIKGADKTKDWLTWGLCVSVLGHCLSFFGASYCGKIPTILYLTFAFVSMIADKLQQTEATQPVSANYDIRSHFLTAQTLRK
jgi:hypothetical protein